MNAMTPVDNLIADTIVLAVLAVVVAVIVALVVLADFAGRRDVTHRQAQARTRTEPMTVDDMLSVVCGPCNDEPRRSDSTIRCGCPAHCGSPACTGRRTAQTVDAEIARMITDYQEGNRG